MANKDERLLIAIDAELKAKLQAESVRTGAPMAEIVRRLIASIPVAGAIEGERVIWKQEA